MSKAFIQSVLSPVIILFSIGSVAAAGAHEGGEVTFGEWIEKQLIVKHDSNWSTEHCMKLSGKRTIEYRFTSAVPLNFGLHLHPETADGSQRTDDLDSRKELLSHEGKVAAELPGTYCFDFFPSHWLKEDKGVHLFYRID